MQFLILGASVAVGLGLIGYWFLNADPAKIRSTAKWLLIVLAALAVIALIFFRRFDWLFYAGVVGLPFLLRAGALFRRVRNAVKTARGPSSGQSSSVRTATLAMTLDHDTGGIDGEVLRGRFSGAPLSELSLGELLELLEDCSRNDPQSVAVLESYLDSAHGPDWRAEAEEMSGAGHHASPGASGPMTRARALEILSLEEGADETAIREAHRRLMMINHPDRGGSDFLAAQINEAKDVLLGS